MCYDRFSSPVGTENRGGSEVEEILTTVHREFGGCTHRCAGKPKRREQDRADPRRRGRARSGTAEGQLSESGDFLSGLGKALDTFLCPLHESGLVEGRRM